MVPKWITSTVCTEQDSNSTIRTPPAVAAAAVHSASDFNSKLGGALSLRGSGADDRPGGRPHEPDSGNSDVGRHHDYFSGKHASLGWRRNSFLDPSSFPRNLPSG